MSRIDILRNKRIDAVLKLPPIPTKFIEITFEENQQDVSKLSKDAVLPFAASPLFETTIRDARILTRGENVKRVLEIELNSNGFNYVPGDTIGILPENSKQDVNFILHRCSLTDIADRPISIKSILEKKHVPKYVPKITTIRNILTHCLSLRSIPKKAFLISLSEFTSNSDEKLRLQELASIQIIDDYREYILNPGVTFIELLKIFESCKPNIELLIESLPQLLPRPYSISSSPLNKSTFTITLSIETNGVCSQYLNQQSSLEAKLENLSLNQNNKINYYFRKSNNFRLPEDGTPIIMVAAGTGIAPFMGFLRHRAKGAWLFFGCRYEDQDYLYKTELEEMVKNETLTKLVVAFSRDNGEYVQDKLKLWKIQLWDLIDKKMGKVFVCGDISKVVKSVREAFLSCLSENLLEEDAKIYLDEMIKNGRYVEDVWN